MSKFARILTQLHTIVEIRALGSVRLNALVVVGPQTRKVVFGRRSVAIVDAFIRASTTEISASSFAAKIVALGLCGCRGFADPFTTLIGSGALALILMCDLRTIKSPRIAAQGFGFTQWIW